MFRLLNIPQEQVHPIVMIECPRLLFPFVRQIVAEATRNGFQLVLAQVPVQ